MDCPCGEYVLPGPALLLHLYHSVAGIETGASRAGWAKPSRSRKSCVKFGRPYGAETVEGLHSQGSVRLRGLHPGLFSFPPSGRKDGAGLCGSKPPGHIPKAVKWERKAAIYLITPRSLRSMNRTSRATSSPSASVPISVRIFSRACVVLSLAASRYR